MTQPIRGNDCLISIASEHGLNPRDCWSSPDNQALRETRQWPNSLTMGDVIELPDNTGGVSLTLDSHHDVVMQEAEFDLPFRLLDAQLAPLANVAVHCAWAGHEDRLSATTDSNGLAHFRLPMICDKGVLMYELDGEQIIRTFTVGTLRPPELDAGMAQRLTNLWPVAIPGTLDQHRLLPALANECALSDDDLYQHLLGDPA